MIFLALFMPFFWLGFERVKVPTPRYELVNKFSYRPPKRRK